jgi:hypothetical protein
MRRGIAAATLALLVGTGALMAAPAGRLAPKDIETTFFTGKPFTASTTSNVKFRMTFKPDGTMTRESLGKATKSGKTTGKTGTVTEGTWKLSQDGFCSSWKGGKENCYRVHENGPNKWAVVGGMQAVAYWSK